MNALATATALQPQTQKKEARKVRGVFEKVPGSGVWWIRFIDAEGKYRREKIGTFSAARKLLDKRRGDALEGKKLPASRKRAVSFAELADDAIAYVEKRYARPADDVARLKLLKERFVGAADAITPGKVESVLDSLTEEKKWSASSRNHHHNLVSVSYRLGIKHSKVKENPARAVKREKENNSRVRFLTPDEEKKLREAIRSNPFWAPHEPEFDLAIATGLRRGSMYSATWENVDLVARTLTIPITKNGEQVVMPLNQDAMRALSVFRSRGDGTGQIVRNASGKPLHYNADWFRPAVCAAGIKPFRWHDCRHTFASRLRQAGVPLANIAELLGHKGLTMTKRYAHLGISNLHEAVSRIASSTRVAPAAVSEPGQVAYIH